MFKKARNMHDIELSFLSLAFPFVLILTEQGVQGEIVRDITHKLGTRPVYVGTRYYEVHRKDWTNTRETCMI